MFVVDRHVIASSSRFLFPLRLQCFPLQYKQKLKNNKITEGNLNLRCTISSRISLHVLVLLLRHTCWHKEKRSSIDEAERKSSQRSSRSKKIQFLQNEIDDDAEDFIFSSPWVGKSIRILFWCYFCCHAQNWYWLELKIYRLGFSCSPIGKARRASTSCRAAED